MVDVDRYVHVFKGYPMVKKAVLFGSRAKGNFRRYSDIDIALFGDLGLLDAEKIACELEELPIVQKFDVVDYQRINNPDLKEHIDRVGVVVYENKSIN